MRHLESLWALPTNMIAYSFKKIIIKNRLAYYTPAKGKQRK